MSLAVQDLRSGVLFKQDGNIYTVLEYHHHKMGRAKAVIRVKVRDVETGGVRELTFNNNDSVNELDAKRTSIDYVFTNDRKEEVVFSDPETKKRMILTFDKVGEDIRKYLAPNCSVQALFNNETGDILTIELPMTVDMKVVQTGPSDKGDTQGSARKPATLESGVVVQVPMFIKIDDVVKVNTQTGEYKERVSN